MSEQLLQKYISLTKKLYCRIVDLEQNGAGGGDGSNGGGGDGAHVITRDIPVTGTVGGFSFGDTLLENTEITDAFDTLLNPFTQPTASSNSLSVSGLIAQVLEVGSTLNATLSFSYNRGIIDSKNDAPNIFLTGDVTGATYTGPNGFSNTTGTLSAPILLGANIYNVEVNYSQGTGSYFNSDGTQANNLDSLRAAGDIDRDYPTVTGAYRYYLDSGSVGSTPNTNANIRAIVVNGFEQGPSTTFNYVITQGDREVAIYTTGTLSQVLYVESSNANVTGTFTQTTVTVNDGAGVPVTYNKYTQDIGGIGYTADATYQITINN